ncbi:FecR family protein [Tenacibaculum lutimaris]|uniref:FecR family protein n=1 Tax=Tenacibaculum lutimaris TaxID=285258 RepID=A0A420E3Y6_9FLAO|nr:FecR family protein [Tenacibaculum lutimaris]RKF04739.1 FecR family protein [Tenacibaculum lutimaris]
MKQNLRIKYLLEKLTNKSLHKNELEELKEALKNEELLEDILEESFNNQDQVHYLDKNNLKKSVWEAIEKRIESKQNQVKIITYNYKWIAALFIIALGVSFFFQKNNSSSLVEIANNDILPKTIQMPDGSKITLRENSRISYHEKFATNRNLTLTGEAFFEVKRDSLYPFSVKADEVTTRVLGTSFTVKTNDSITKISVNTGLVSVQNSSKKEFLRPDELAIFNRKHNTFYKGKTKAVAHNLWAMEQVSFKEITLLELSEVFKTLYEKEIIFSNEDLKAKKLYAFYIKRNESLEKLIDRINYINEVELKNYNNDIRITAKL